MPANGVPLSKQELINSLEACLEMRQVMQIGVAFYGDLLKLPMDGRLRTIIAQLYQLNLKALPGFEYNISYFQQALDDLIQLEDQFRNGGGGECG